MVKGLNICHPKEVKDSNPRSTGKFDDECQVAVPRFVSTPYPLRLNMIRCHSKFQSRGYRSFIRQLNSISNALIRRQQWWWLAFRFKIENIVSIAYFSIAYSNEIDFRQSEVCACWKGVVSSFRVHFMHKFLFHLISKLTNFHVPTARLRLPAMIRVWLDESSVCSQFTHYHINS